MAIKIRIKAPLYLACPPTCLCGQSIDDYGLHLFKCRIGGEWEHRHNTLVQLFSSILKSVNLTVQQEVPLINLGPLAASSNSATGRMDLHITSCDSPSFLADVTVTHPSPADSNNLVQEAFSPSYFAKHAENRKIRKYRAASEQIGQRFVPIALETYGALGPECSKMLKNLAGRRYQLCSESDTENFSRSSLTRIWRVKISAALQRANARLIISKANRIRNNLRQNSQPNPHNVILTDQWEIT